MELKKQRFELELPQVLAAPGSDTLATRTGLSWKAKALYGIGEASNSIKSFTFGLFLLFFFTSFFIQEAASLAILASGVLVDLFAGLVPGQFEQSPETINRLGILFGLLPATLVLAAALLILGYRLSRRRVEAIQMALAAHHEESSDG
jgi:Na+/melibiose symporter-like transporter